MCEWYNICISGAVEQQWNEHGRDLERGRFALCGRICLCNDDAADEL